MRLAHNSALSLGSSHTYWIAVSIHICVSQARMQCSRHVAPAMNHTSIHLVEHVNTLYTSPLFLVLLQWHKVYQQQLE